MTTVDDKASCRLRVGLAGREDRDGPLPAITAGAKFGEKPTVAKGEGDPPKELAVKT